MIDLWYENLCRSRSRQGFVSPPFRLRDLLRWRWWVWNLVWRWRR